VALRQKSKTNFIDQFSGLLSSEMIRKYVKYQEEKDRYIDQLKFGF